MVFETTKRFIASKLKSVEFLNTNCPQDYEVVNTEYRRLRSELDTLTAVVDSLSTYEFGGSVMKNFSKLGNKLSSTTSIKMFESNDVYTQAAMVGDELANTTHNSSIKHTGTKFSEAYRKIAAAKKKMNGQLKEVTASMKVLKEEAKTIDRLREKAQDLRRQLEIIVQEGKAPKAQVDSLTSDFNSKALEALRAMKTFMGEVGLSGHLKKIAGIHREFSEESYSSLSNVQ